MKKAARCVGKERPVQNETQRDGLFASKNNYKKPDK
jgi:hypothetical protein